MKLTPIAANRNLVTFNDGTEVFFSYKTPVAGYSNELGYVRTKTWYSQTTTKHINKYLYDSSSTLSITCKEVDQEVIDNLVSQSNAEVKQPSELEALSNTEWGKNHLEVVIL